jgi:hypothetical protein
LRGGPPKILPTGRGSGQDFLDSRHRDRKVQSIIHGLKRPTRQSPKELPSTRLLSSGDKSEFYRRTLRNQGHFREAGKSETRKRKPREIKGRNRDQGANNDSLPPNCTYYCSAKGWLEGCSLPMEMINTDSTNDLSTETFQLAGEQMAI